MNERILEGALKVFKEKGPKFTMDDLATEMKMSKKTIYTIFSDKNELMCDMMDYAFDLIKAAEDKVYNDESLGIVAVLPESHYGFDYSAMHQLANKYPMAYQKMNDRLDGGWEKTMELLRKGIEEGAIRDVDLNIFKLMYEACVDRLLMGDYLKSSGMDYPTALAEVVDVMVDGITKRED